MTVDGEDARTAAGGHGTGPATPEGAEFDRDTAVHRDGPGTYRALLSPGWTVGHAVNGGYLLSVAARALGDALAHPDPLTVTAHYLTASRPGPAVVHVDPARPGRTVASGQARLVQDGGERGVTWERVRVLATYGDLDGLTGAVRTSARPPELPPYQECPRYQDLPADGVDMPELIHRFDVRFDPATVGWAHRRPSGRGEVRAWFALADGRAADPLVLLLAADALPPVAFDLGVTGWVPTLSLTVHVRCRPAPGPLRVVMRTRNLAGGLVEEHGEIWDARDRLVAESLQLARVRGG